jgi:hypothetical protein
MNPNTYERSPYERAMAKAMEEYRRCGVFRPPVPEDVAAYESTRHMPAPFGVDGHEPPAPPACPVQPPRVLELLRESAGMEEHVAQSYISRTLRMEGAPSDLVVATMRADQRQRDAGRQWA